MTERSRRTLQALGRAFGRVAEQSGPSRTLAEVRRRVVHGPLPRRERLARRALVPAVLAAALVAVLWAVVAHRDPPVTFAVGDPPEPGTVGAWLAADVGQAVPVAFSDGSTLTVEPGARIRVTGTSARGAMVLLEKGTLRTAVAEQSRPAHWQVSAGPFAVEVVGTRFSTSWDPMDEVLAVTVQSGRVAVRGPVVEQRTVRRGQRLRVDVGRERVQIESVSGVAAEPPAPASAEARAEPTPAPLVEVAQGGGAGTPTPSASGAPAAASASAARWQSHAAEGNHRQAMAALDEAAFAAAVRQSSAGTLRVLADSARLGGRPDRARAALMALRTQHGARGETAFLLGKIAADQLGSSGEAVRWFQAYLTEAPRGPLAEQALGRLLELQQHGDPEVVAGLAQRYLARYPRGSHAPLARRLANP